MKQSIAVLVIEDNYDDFYLLREVLKTSDEIEATVFHAERLADGLNAAGEHVLDAVIIDLSLPDSIGLDTYTAFHGRYPLVPTIIMTGDKDYDLAFEAVRNGAQDYLFKGESSATAIIRTIRYAIERQRLTTELQTALEHVKQLQGMLPICSVCKNIRDDKGYWNHIEEYISEHSEVRFSHGFCPDCARKLYPDVFADDK